MLGKELERFEERFADLVKKKYVVGVGSGYDALYISVRCVEGDYVFVPKPLHESTLNAVTLAGKSLVEDPKDADIIIPTISSRKNWAMSTYYNFAYNAVVVEDACRSIGIRRRASPAAITSCYSFHPLKLLHCYGDGGAIALNDGVLYKTIKEFRNHGRVGKSKHYGVGVNSRLDEIQAAVLNVMMDKLKGRI